MRQKGVGKAALVSGSSGPGFVPSLWSVGLSKKFPLREGLRKKGEGGESKRAEKREPPQRELAHGRRRTPYIPLPMELVEGNCPSH